MAFTAGTKLRASDLVALDNRAYLSVYTMSNTVTSTTYTIATPALASGTGLGLSLATNLFTLGAGTWDVDWSLWLGGSATTNLILAIGNDATATIVVATTYVSGSFVGVSTDTAGTVSTQITSAGATTVSFKCFIPSATGAGTPAQSRISLNRTSTS